MALECGLCLIGVVDFAQRAQHGLVVLQQRRLQAGIGRGDIGLDAAVGEYRHLNAHAQEAAPAFERAVAIHFDAAALPQKVNRKARQQIGFGAGEFGGISVDLRGMGADVGAALEHTLRGLALGRGGLLCQHVYAAFR